MCAEIQGGLISNRPASLNTCQVLYVSDTFSSEEAGSKNAMVCATTPKAMNNASGSRTTYLGLER